MALISASVGLGGRNKPTDVALMQQLLNPANASTKLVIDGLINQLTNDAIKHFLKTVVKMANPDSRINANGGTLKALIKASGYKQTPAALSTVPGLIRVDTFVSLYNKQYSPLITAYQNGLTELVTAITNDKEINNIHWAAYMLATTMHETDRTFLPIEEYGKGSTRKYGKEIEVSDKAGKKYKNIYYGRGYVQLTWDYNYQTIGEAIGLGEELYIHPEKALESETAYKIMSYGMRKGTFTGKKLSTYITGTIADYYNARKIINGLDKAQLIQGYAETLEQLLRLSQNTLKETSSIVECTPTANICFA